MARVDRTGVTPTDLAGYRAIFQRRFRDAFGQDLALDDETPQAQWIGIASLAMAEADEVFVADANAISISRGAGYQLDDNGQLLNIRRLLPARSTVTVNLTGTAGTVITQGSRVRTTTGAEFRTTAAVTLTGSSDTVQMESVEIGPIVAAAGTLTEIVTPIAGWTAVTNPSDATLGRLLETDAAYRIRYPVFTPRLAVGFPSAIRAQILEVPNVTRAIVHNNDTNADVTTQMLVIPAHGILAIVLGGTDDAVALAIAQSKTGAATGGATQIVTSLGAINFQRVAETAVAVTIMTTVGADFPADGINLIKRAVAANAAATWQIGAVIDLRALIGAAYSVTGHVLDQNPTVLDTNGNALTAPNLNVLYTLSESNVTVTTS